MWNSIFAASFVVIFVKCMKICKFWNRANISGLQNSRKVMNSLVRILIRVPLSDYVIFSHFSVHGK